MEGEEDGRPWALQRHEAEDEEIEDEVQAAADAQILANPARRNLGVIAEGVRRRLVEFLSINRPQLPADEEENVYEEIEDEAVVDDPIGPAFQLVLPF